jgi:predicted nicotinamide N-methyase
MKPQVIISIAGLGLMAACAGSGADYQPILDGTPTPAYRADLAACQALARNQNQFDQETLGATVLGAGAGAALARPIAAMPWVGPLQAPLPEASPVR